MNRRKKGFSYDEVFGSRSVLCGNAFSKISHKSFSPNKNLISLDSSHSSNKNLISLDSISFSSNKPGFIGFITNRGIDDELLKGGFKKI